MAATNNNKSCVNGFYLVVLQVLWIFRIFYDIMVTNKNSVNNHAASKSKQLINSPSSPKPNLINSVGLNRRHLIQLVTAEPPKNDRNEITGRPICYMHVSEIMSPMEEEMLRCVCAKGTSSSSSNDQKTNLYFKRNFTNTLFDSCTLGA